MARGFEEKVARFVLRHLGNPLPLIRKLSEEEIAALLRVDSLVVRAALLVTAMSIAAGVWMWVANSEPTGNELEVYLVGAGGAAVALLASVQVTLRHRAPPLDRLRLLRLHHTVVVRLFGPPVGGSVLGRVFYWASVSMVAAYIVGFFALWSSG